MKYTGRSQSTLLRMRRVKYSTKLLKYLLVTVHLVTSCGMYSHIILSYLQRNYFKKY